MAKRVRVNVPGVRINETDRDILRAIASRAEERTGLRCTPVEMSYRQMRMRVPVSEPTAMRACASLRDNGLVRIEHVHLENGGQSGNQYEVTALGLEVLRLADELEALGV